MPQMKPLLWMNLYLYLLLLLVLFMMMFNYLFIYKLSDMGSNKSMMINKEKFYSLKWLW